MVRSTGQTPLLPPTVSGPDNKPKPVVKLPCHRPLLSKELSGGCVLKTGWWWVGAVSVNDTSPRRRRMFCWCSVEGFRPSAKARTRLVLSMSFKRKEAPPRCVPRFCHSTCAESSVYPPGSVANLCPLCLFQNLTFGSHHFSPPASLLSSPSAVSVSSRR
jgi:hypothetical protein